ncbi:MAG TPA: class I SAM-dependent methyltransferase [Streptosporangiaceae bacterium]|nr:class I SAM-dependent methyltransferase [Streptosporangiaceae bacterium]
MNLAGSWEQHADAWIRWARASPHDGFEHGTWPALRELLPAPGPGPVIDLGCGEGRGSRELRALGHRVVGADYSPTLTRAARACGPAIPVLRADAAALPFAEQSADLVVACMSLLDFDDFGSAVAEIGRVLRPRGQLCLAIVHPFISAQDEDTLHTPSSGFSRPYLETRRYTDHIERDGLAMTFSSMHRPLSAYIAALTGQGLAITALTEHGDGMIPWLLAMRAGKIQR